MKKTTTFLMKAIVTMAVSSGNIAYANTAILAPAETSFDYATALPSEVPPSRLWINLLNSNGDGAQTAIAYLEQSTTGLDYGYDAARITDPGTIGLYSICENMELVIQARPAFDSTDTVTLGFTTPVGGTYTIELYMATGVFENGQKVYIKDNVTNTVTEITNGDYVFETEAGTFNNRFTVQYTPDINLGTTTVTAENVVVASHNGSISINAGSTILSSATLYDINGRELYKASNINLSTVMINQLLEKQVIIAKIETTSGKIHTKKFVI